ncbi:MAG: amidohydrolase [Chloroflexi bacterium]|nr:amidohydrolase [Chloroflexota bacterium]
MTLAAVRSIPATPPGLVALRRDLHAHPELRFAEHRTAGIVAARLRDAGYEVRAGIGGTGILASRDSGLPGRHVVIRADLDALPVSDLKAVDYASTVDGVAHACGHDVHIVVALGVAERLASGPLPGGRISFLFQPAEERPFGEPSGARAVLETGVLDNPAPDSILAFHCWPDLPAGTVGIDERIAMGAKDAFRVVYVGNGAHAAAPSRGRDAVLGIARLITALYETFARSLDPGERASLNIGTVRGGATQSVVPDRAEITGTLRTIDPEVRERLRGRIERVAAGVAATFALETELTWADEMPPILNDPALVRLAEEVATEVLGSEQARRLTEPPMTVDDFALLASRAPALYLKLGISGDGTPVPLHNGAFDVDERSIGVGVAVMHRIALALLSDAAPGGGRR